MDEGHIAKIGPVPEYTGDEPGLRLYERFGFRRMSGWEVRNRAGSLGMVLDDPLGSELSR